MNENANEDQEGLPMEEPTVTYLTPQSPTFSIQLAHGTVSAVKGVLRLTPSQAREVDHLLKTRGDMRANVVKVDRAAAEAAAKAHMARMSPAAQKGAAHSGMDAKTVMRDVNEAQKAEMLAGTHGAGEVKANGAASDPPEVKHPTIIDGDPHADAKSRAKGGSFMNKLKGK